MDRNNTTRVGVSGKLNVALRKESVDRNIILLVLKYLLTLSLSARRAWIEILCCVAHVPGYLVALRKESVDRNM